MGATVLPVASRALLGACRKLGVDVDALLARAGLARAALDDPDARLPAESADSIWREAYAATRDPLLALHAAGATPFGAFRVLDYLGVSGRTLGEGFRRIACYFPLIDPRATLTVEESAGPVALVFRATEGAPLPAPAQEYTFAVLLSRARHATAARWDPREVRFSFPRPPDAREHARSFGVTPRFGAHQAALVLPRDAWEHPTSGRDPGLFTMLDEHARKLAATAAPESDLIARVRAAIAADLPGGDPSLASTARRVALSRRSLQRGLEVTGSSFAQLVDEVRRERAETFLREPDVSIAEVSWLVGFSEQSAFARAFKRWMGESPTEYRRARASGRVDRTKPGR